MRKREREREKERETQQTKSHLSHLDDIDIFVKHLSLSIGTICSGNTKST
jgi:hypothetical protein